MSSSVIHFEIRALLAFATLCLVSCDSVNQVSTAAESARAATERMAYASVEASNRREQQIQAEAIERAAAEEARQGFNNNTGPRYAIRKDGAGWAIYDNLEGRTARMGAKVQSGLSRAAVEAAYQSLQEEAQSEAAFARRRR